MKRLLSYLIVASFLVACGKKVEIIEPPFVFDDNLLQIDSMMQHDADSALQMLLSFRVERGFSSKFNDNYHSLLLSEALYKTNNPQLNRYRNETFQETSLQDAMHYFDSLDFTMLSARSHYMNGVGYYESDSVIEACKEYLKTLEIMEDHFDVENLTGYKAKFMGLTYTRLGRAYYNCYNSKASVDFYKSALVEFRKNNNYDLSNTYKWIGNAFCLDNQNDSALYYYRIAKNIAKQRDDLSVYYSILADATPAYYYTGYSDSAFLFIKESLLNNSNDNQKLAKCFTLGLLFKEERCYDSAIYYLEKSKSRDDFNTIAASEELLIDCYKAIGDTSKVQLYTNKHNESLDLFVNSENCRVEMNELYVKYKLDKINSQHKIKLGHGMRMFLYVLLFVVMVFITIVAITHIKLKNKNNIISSIKSKNNVKSFECEPICKYILGIVNTQNFKSQTDYRIYSEYSLKLEQITQLRDAVDSHFGQFTKELKEKYSVLTEDDINYCCLYILGLKDADISALMQRSYRAVCDRNKKLRSIFNTTNTLNMCLRDMYISKLTD